MCEPEAPNGATQQSPLPGQPPAPSPRTGRARPRGGTRAPRPPSHGRAASDGAGACRPAGAEDEGLAASAPGSVGIRALEASQECSIVTPALRPPGWPSGAGRGPLTLAAFLFVPCLAFCPASFWGIPAVKTEPGEC